MPNPEPARESLFTTRFRHKDTGVVYAPGTQVHRAGDVNNDGTPDFIVSMPPIGANWNGPASLNTGTVFLRSGIDGTIIHQLFGSVYNTSQYSSFGHAACGMGDVNGDGFGDVAVSVVAIPNGATGSFDGAVQVYSGIDGSALATIVGTPGATTGIDIANLGDLNGDGIAELAIAERFSVGATFDGHVLIYSGADWSLFRTIDDPVGTMPAASIANAFDVNGDGVDDILIGQPLYGASATPGRAQVFSGSDGSLLHEFIGSIHGRMGSSVAGLGDINNDGFADVLIAEPDFAAPAGSSSVQKAGRARVYSGVDGAPLFSFDNVAFNGKIASTVACVGDINGDGVNDLAFDHLQPAFHHSNAAMLIYSGANGSLVSVIDGHDIPETKHMDIAGIGDVNGDGFGDVATSSILFDTDPNTENDGETRLFLGGTPPTEKIYSSSGASPALDLEWWPRRSNPNHFIGNYRSTGATPGALGVIVASLATIDFPILGFDLLVAIDSINLLTLGTMGANAAGEFTVGNLSRSYPPLAGQGIYLQVFETTPAVKASNAIKMILLP